MRAPAIQQTYKNRVLASLPSPEVARLKPYLSHLTLKAESNAASFRKDD